ncbi:hypothetical protein M406DRAFT_321486 [Cryphonectria parasitica EP155]|uniref:Stress response RCI peptide n=1 Tax=Cryphonectria parasitica (strain ATCC 38755 / EP155) TaxID=660469 RepID=A0A9P4Y6A4_CRYP1|nr:uncharacterized protein M406DRAFT_321486 [Cryphonectria parasitica EP155]KAF3767157.1 hypothetical protein M406DRAFT_321486 [Cryphonectria parasitica EP155]
MCSSDIFLGLLALLFPPLPVWVKCGICSADSVINILLCVLGYIPGLLHAWYIIAKFPEPNYNDYERVGDSERGGRVAYVVVQEGGDERRSQRPAGRGPAKPPGQQANMTYGTNTRENAEPSSQAHGHQEASAGPSDGAPPPSYAQVVAGDNKIQDHS